MLLAVEDPDEVAKEESGDAEQDGAGCSFCGGLGHRITNCPKLQTNLRSQQANMRDVIGGAAYGGNW